MQIKLRKSAYLLAIAVLLTLIATKVWSQSPSTPVDFQRGFTVSPGAKLVVENYTGRHSRDRHRWQPSSGGRAQEV